MHLRLLHDDQALRESCMEMLLAADCSSVDPGVFVKEICGKVLLGYLGIVGDSHGS